MVWAGIFYSRSHRNTLAKAMRYLNTVIYLYIKKKWRKASHSPFSKMENKTKIKTIVDAHVEEAVNHTDTFPLCWENVLLDRSQPFLVAMWLHPNT